jgi:hypothetical protein
VMAKRSDRGLAKLLRSLGMVQTKPAAEMSTNLANDHQGQRREASCLHQQAGYKTASQPPRLIFQKLTCHTGGVHIRSAGLRGSESAIV